MIKLKLYILFFITVVGLAGCSTRSFLPEGETLYTGVEVEFDEHEDIDNTKKLKEDLETKLYPKPAEKFLGLGFVREYMYMNVNPKEGKTRGFKYFLKNKFGEKPIYISQINTELMNSINSKTMQDNGYFKCSSSSTVESKNGKGIVTYKVESRRPARIDSIIFPSTGSDIDTIIANYRYLRIRQGQPYNLDNFTKDREDLATFIRNSGYFDFDQKDLFYLLDTAGKSPDFDVYFKIKPPKNDSIHRKFYIRNVDIYVTNANNIAPDSSKYSLEPYRGLRIHHEYPFISNKTIYANTLIEPDHRFSIDAFNYTTGRFINMDIFDFVNINYTRVGRDKLDVVIVLNPSLSHSFSTGIEANTSNRSFLGGSVHATYVNRNATKKADRFIASTNIGAELQNNNGQTQFNIFTYGGELKYEVPRLFFFLKTGKLPSEKAPLTIAALNYNHQHWLQYYTLNSFNLTYGYKWTNASRFHHDIKPITFNFIDVSSTTASFQQNLDDNPLLAISFIDQIIEGSQYRFSFNTKRKSDQKSYFYFQNIFEMAGNKSWLISKLINPNPSGQYTMLGVPYAQFLRNEVELRFHNDITAKKSFVARGEIGLGYAYGNSDILPFTKKFFAGGPNTIRGFGFRSLGPGRYNYADGSSRINPIQQSGDIKVLLNAEYRFPLYYIFKGAFFIDAGNIWLLENDPERPSGAFRFNQFIGQMALSGGFGVRLDFDYFVIRGDVGIPIYKPYLEPQDRWITAYQSTSAKQWRKDNAILNVAIGYPF